VRKRLGFAAVVLAATAVLAAPVAGAATITVTTSAGVSGGPKCALRDAIEAANTNSAKGGCGAGESSGTDRIEFSLPAPSTIAVVSTLPSVTGATAIVGPGAAQLTISGSDTVRIIETSGEPVAISGLTLAHGSCSFGCGLRNVGTLTLENVVVADNTTSITGGTNAFPQGGGLENTGTMTLVGSTVSGNFSIAKNASNQTAASSAGILNHGKLTIVGSTISDNTSSAVSSGGTSASASGPGITNFKELTIQRSTISGNLATASGAAGSNSSQGGGISNANDPVNVKVRIERSTISGNTATASSAFGSQAGGFNVFGASFVVSGSTIVGNSAQVSANTTGGSPATFKNTIVARPLGGGPNCGTTVTSLGFNLTDTAGCGFTQPTDQASTDPMLAPAGLADNGGPTKTIALLAGSAAIDKGLSAAGEITDQRGLTRPVEIPAIANAVGGDGTDIGAFEVQLPPPPIPALIPPGDTTRPRASIKNVKPKTYKHKLKIVFRSSEAGSTFRCKLDAKPYRSCRSPLKTKRLALGPHRFAVIATDPAGNSSPAAKKKFKILTRPVPSSKPVRAAP
jgi:hypothetical protein